jgi:hypothetical protein
MDQVFSFDYEGAVSPFPKSLGDVYRFYPFFVQVERSRMYKEMRLEGGESLILPTGRA